MLFLKMEILKIRRSRLWLPLLVLPVLAILFGTGNYLGNREVLQREWLSLFTQVYLFYSMLFFPTLVGLLVAFVWHNEHKKNALKLMLVSRYSPLAMVMTKTGLVFGLVMVAQLFLLLLYGLVGAFLHFEMGFPWVLCAYTLAGTLFILPLIAIQSYLSLRVKSFALPVACAMGLGLIGFFVSAQSHIPELANVFAFSKITLVLNNLDSLMIDLAVGECLKMSGWSFLVTVGFSLLQLYYFEKMRR